MGSRKLDNKRLEKCGWLRRVAFSADSHWELIKLIAFDADKALTAVVKGLDGS